MKSIMALVLIFLTNVTCADILSVHCPLGCPSNPTNNDLIFGHVYALSNNPKTKFSDWVAYEVNVLNFGDSPGRIWRTDPLLHKDETLEEKDYKGANSSDLEADKGHQAPLASFAGSQYWSELNYLSNITPQDEDLNQGPWKELEGAVRGAVGYRDSLYVITGPLFEGAMPQLPNADESHKVPSGYFKVVYNKQGNATGFIMEQSSSRNSLYCSKRKPLTEIQARTGFTLPVFNESASMKNKLGCDT